jgi:hypothetical protein
MLREVKVANTSKLKPTTFETGFYSVPNKIAQLRMTTHSRVDLQQD